MATAAILPIISGLAGLFGGGKQQQQSGSATTSGTQTTRGGTTSSSSPNLSPLQEELARMFSTRAMDFANTAPDLTGYTQGGIQNINQANAGANAATRNLLAARGLAYSPAYATAATMGDQNRQNQITQFLAQIPLLQRQLQSQGIGELEKAFSTVPIGTTTEGTTDMTQSSSGSTNQTGTVSGNPLAGLFSGLGAGLGAPSSAGNIGNNLNDILASLGWGTTRPKVINV